eukprot:3939832-Rhodomonas_salina.1
MSGIDVAPCITRLRVSYAMSGTNIARATPRWLQSARHITSRTSGKPKVRGKRGGTLCDPSVTFTWHSTSLQRAPA